MNRQGKIIDGYKYFESQQDDEKVVFVIRKHWFILFKPFIVGVVIIILTITFSFLAQGLEEQFLSKVGSTILTVIVSLIFLFTILYVYLSWLIHYLNIVILTNEHLVEIEQSALFSRKVSELSLDCLQDATFIQKGFWKTIFHFGDVSVQTAGSLPNFEFNGVPYPYETAQKIMQAQDEYRKNNRVGDNNTSNLQNTKNSLPNIQESDATQKIGNNTS